MSCLCSNFWKGGGSIDNLTRQQIWEENFKIRENLRGVQRSEHFWDFQMTNASSACHCESPKRPLPRCKSLHTLDRLSKANTPVVIQEPVRSSPVCVGRCRRDVGTETTPPRVDKSVGPGPRREPTSRNAPLRPFIAGSVSTCPRYRPPDWARNESISSKQQRQESLQKLRKSEEILQQAMQRKRTSGNGPQWGTEYSRSYKDAGWPRALNGMGRRVGTPLPRHSMDSTPLMLGRNAVV